MLVEREQKNPDPKKGLFQDWTVHVRMGMEEELKGGGRRGCFRTGLCTCVWGWKKSRRGMEGRVDAFTVVLQAARD